MVIEIDEVIRKKEKNEREEGRTNDQPAANQAAGTDGV